MRILRWIAAAALVLAVLTGCSLFQATVVITNDSSYTLTEVYISPSDETTWGSDLLSTSINPGSSKSFDGISPGTYDLKVVTSGALYQTKMGIPLTANQTFTWTVTN